MNKSHVLPEGELLEKIRQLGFVKNELELFLDTHPSTAAALDYFRNTVDELNRLTEAYEAVYGPITAAGCIADGHWSWIGAPWPWQRAEDAKDMKGVK